MRCHDFRDGSALAGKPGRETAIVLLRPSSGFAKIALQLLDLSSQPFYLTVNRAFGLLAMTQMGDLFLSFPGQVPRFCADPGCQLGRVVDHPVAGRAQSALRLLRLQMGVPSRRFQVAFRGFGIETEMRGRVPHLARDAMPRLFSGGGHLFTLSLGCFGRLSTFPLDVSHDVFGSRRDLFGARRGTLFLFLVASEREQQRRYGCASHAEQNHFDVESVILKLLMHVVHPFPAWRVAAPGLVTHAEGHQCQLYPGVSPVPAAL